MIHLQRTSERRWGHPQRTDQIVLLAPLVFLSKQYCSSQDFGICFQPSAFRFLPCVSRTDILGFCWCSVIALRIATAVLGGKSHCVSRPILTLRTSNTLWFCGCRRDTAVTQKKQQMGVQDKDCSCSTERRRGIKSPKNKKEEYLLTTTDELLNKPFDPACESGDEFERRTEETPRSRSLAQFPEPQNLGTLTEISSLLRIAGKVWNISQSSDTQGMNMVLDWENLLCPIKDHGCEMYIQDVGRSWMSSRYGC